MNIGARSPRLCSVVATIAVALLGACTDDPMVPAAGVPGDYHATRLAVSASGVPVNLLAVGASLSLVLAEDHTTTGRLIVPASIAGSAIDQSLAGAWRQSHDTVFFSGPAETFITDVPFLVRGAGLTADQTMNGTRLQVTLSK